MLLTFKDRKAVEGCVQCAGSLTIVGGGASALTYVLSDIINILVVNVIGPQLDTV